MSELKARTARSIADAEEMLELGADCPIEPAQVYLKSEADKAIARHKYKRCLAMARIAQDDWHLHNSFYAMGHQEFEKRKCSFYERWHKRWLELAEMFK